MRICCDDYLFALPSTARFPRNAFELRSICSSASSMRSCASASERWRSRRVSYTAAPGCRRTANDFLAVAFRPGSMVLRKAVFGKARPDAKSSRHELASVRNLTSRSGGTLANIAMKARRAAAGSVRSRRRRRASRLRYLQANSGCRKGPAGAECSDGLPGGAHHVGERVPAGAPRRAATHAATGTAARSARNKGAGGHRQNTLLDVKDLAACAKSFLQINIENLV